ncbi:uncharacterized protein LOC112847167 [Oreochromis niloticus]|uniref:uncharacterized protein LOC112847167 n=1 Tax=Oreochromis niloticus TaxID=8128 RepID=UPI000DF4394C|nr:uncharacterized protein LOC112847167 [Oreochromis niloticus]
MLLLLSHPPPPHPQSGPQPPRPPVKHPPPRPPVKHPLPRPPVNHHISEDLSWTTNTASLAKKAQQRLYFLRKLKRASAPPPILTTFYRGTIESILSSCITVWGSSCTDYNRKALQRIVRTAERIVGVPLPSLQDIYTTRLTRKAITIVNDATHPAHCLFSLLPSGKRYRSLRSRTTKLTNSFIHQAVRLLNSLPSRLPASRTTRLAGV